MIKRNTRRGFTLIELLVVVLIIGILAAIALPQYQKAVLKSRVSSLIPLAKAIADSNEVYYLENGEYAEELQDLPAPVGEGNTKVMLSPKERFKYILAYNNNFPNVHYIVYQNHSPEFAKNIHCEAKSDDKQAQWVCEQGLGGTKLDSGRVTKGFTTYILQGSPQDGVFYYTYYNEAPSYVTDGDVCNGTRANGGCSGRSYDNESKCYANDQNTCAGGSHFDNGSICQTDTTHYYGCNGNTFDNQSVCIGNHIETCVGATFLNGSICYANAGPSSYVPCRDSHYDSTSYCAGRYCPAGTPAGDKDGIFAGECWDGNGNHSSEYCS